MTHVAIKLKAESFDDTCTQALTHIAKVATDVRLKLGKDINMPPDLLALMPKIELLKNLGVTDVSGLQDTADAFRSKKRCRTQS